MTAEPVGDLEPGRVTAALGGRPARAYPALVSTEHVAMAWAREGAPSGAVVVAEYQASPRGRAGLPWTVHPVGRGLGFSLVHREALSHEREGWPYIPALLGLDDVVGAAGGAILEWPDAIRAPDGAPLVRIGVHVELGPARMEWSILTVLVEDAVPPRADLLAGLASAVERRLAQAPEEVLHGYRPRCGTLGRTVRARLLPIGPDGPEVQGEAVDVLTDGALVLLTARGNRVAVPPQNLGLLEDPQGPVEPPRRLLGERGSP